MTPLISKALSGLTLKRPLPLFLTFLFFMLLVLDANPAGAEYSIGAGGDVTHAQGTIALTGRYEERFYRYFHYAGEAMGWTGPHGGANGAVAADIGVNIGPVELGVGPAYIFDTNDINGTNWNFNLMGAVNLGDHFAVEFTHFSNGKKIFHYLQDKHNAGWNFVGVSYRF